MGLHGTLVPLVPNIKFFGGVVSDFYEFFPPGEVDFTAFKNKYM